jgi:hypothetical protein
MNIHTSNRKETKVECLSREALSGLLANFNGSIVCSNSENNFDFNSWPLTNNYLENTRIYNFNDGQNSESFNWLPLCKQNPKLCFKLAKAIFTTEDDNLDLADAFNQIAIFNQRAVSLLAGMFAHISTLKLATPADVYDLVINSNLNELVSALEASESPVARNCAKIFSPFNYRVQISTLNLLEQKLAFLQNAQVRKVTSTTSTTPDFSSLKHQESLILWLVPKEQTKLLEPLTNLFFALLADQLDKAKGKLTVDILPNCKYLSGAFSLSEEEILYRAPQYNQLLISSQTTNTFNSYYQ